MEPDTKLAAEEGPLPVAVSQEPDAPAPLEVPTLGGEVEKPKPPQPKARGKKRKAKVLKDITAPRQPLTGYVRYLNERRENLRASNPRLGFAEVTKRLASEWGRLPAPDKQQYLDAAEQDRERYIKEWSAYKETDAYRSFKQQQQERKEAAGQLAGNGGATAAKKPRGAAANHQPPKTSDVVLPASAPPSESPAPVMANGGHGTPALPPSGAAPTHSAPPSWAPKSNVTPSSGLLAPTCLFGAESGRGGDPNQRETDIPIFTEQFLQHNKLRETELRQLRKANTDYEQQNAILQKHMENMRGAVERARSESAAQRARASALRAHLTALVDRLVRGLGDVPLPGMTGATKQNIETYMESLRSLASSNKNHTAVKQARDFLTKLEIPE